MTRTRIDWFVVLIALSLSVGCGGGGCGGCAGLEPIPGGFPAAERVPKAAQVRVTSHTFDKIEADPATFLGGFVGGNSSNGVITFAVPASCSGTRICCSNGTTPDPNCGPLMIDLVPQAGDTNQRLSLNPNGSVAAPNGELDVDMYARVWTVNDLIVTISGQNCTIKIDTRAGASPDLHFHTAVGLTQDGTAKTTRVDANSTSADFIDNGTDYDIGGDALCAIGSFIPTSVIEGLIANMIEGQINDATCKACPGGTVAECGSPYATKCESNVCKMANGDCFEELGLAGRLRGSIVFSSISPGTTGAMDLYEVAGGYSTSNAAGLSLGILGGMLPAGIPRDLCGPAVAQPAMPTVPTSTFFQGNARPDTSDAFDVGFGLHQSQLDALAYAGYEGGLFCLTIGSSTVAQLSTDTISLLSRSLGTLVESNSPMAVGLRPQSPPTLKLGKNTFKDDGSGTMVPDDPIIDLRFKGLEIDFLASIDDQYNRVFTVVTDVHLPIGLQTSAMGKITPVIGNPDDAFTNITVKNSDAITETPDEIAGLFPTLLNLVVPQLSSGLPGFALPNVGGLALDITSITSVPATNGGVPEFLGIFMNLVPATMSRVRPVDTKAALLGITEPKAEIARDVRKWRSAHPPAATLELGGTATDLEFSWRVDNGGWTGWTTNRRPTVTSSVFWLPGVHKVEVRSRQIGHPETIDPDPAVIQLAMGTDLPNPDDKRPTVARADFHGQAGSSGCNCDTATPSGGIVLALVFGLVLVPRRRLRLRRRLRRHLRGLAREAMRLGPIVWLTAIALLPGCSCGSNPCGSVDCLPGEVERGSVGRFTSIAADTKRVLVATYDQGNGDLVVVDATDPKNIKYRAVDGVPDITPTYDPDGYRGGIEDAGDNVGAWTSIAVAEGLGRVAYQDRDAAALKFAYETKKDHWSSYVLDSGDAITGMYTSLVIDGDKHPAIAYVATGIDDGMGHRTTELRLARASDDSPSEPSDWGTFVLATAPGSCGGLCGSQSCVAGATAGDPQVCVTATTDCTATCADTEVCVMGACRARIDEPKVVTPPLGTGIYANLVVLPDGRLVAVYYDQTRRALVLAAEGSKGSSTFTETLLDGNVVGADRGMWAAATAGSDGTVHVAYQDALGDQLMYTTWNGSAGTPAVVDDGTRSNDRTHPVGAGAAIYVSGGVPSIVYQDGLASDVYLATQSGGAWTRQPLAQGAPLDGFSIGATVGNGAPVYAWGTLDPAQTIVGSLTIQR